MGDNNRDTVERGRGHYAYGTENHQAKLTAQDIREIRAHGAHRTWGGRSRLAMQYGVHRTTIRDILARKIWSWVEDERPRAQPPQQRPETAPLPVRRAAVKPDAAERFWWNVKRAGPQECWLWMGSLSDKGYGDYNTPHFGTHVAHRVSYLLMVGPIPPGLFVLHNCPGGDNRRCVNPAHLYVGTHRTNMADMKAKGRARGKRRLTDCQVEEIRVRYDAGGVAEATLAQEYGITQSNIGMIVRGASYKNAPGPISASPSHARGHQHKSAKLTPEQVRAIRVAYVQGGISQPQLAATYAVSPTTIHFVVHGRHYGEVEGGPIVPVGAINRNARVQLEMTEIAREGTCGGKNDI